MDEFQTKAINTAANPQRTWRRYADDTFVILESEQRTEFLQNINPRDYHMQFTTEKPNTDGSIPFLYRLVTLLTTVFRKATHTDQYLHLDSHHNLYTKYSVYRTITHRARTVCANPGGPSEMQVSYLGTK